MAWMDHLAIMRRSWKLTPKILSGKKKIESRWYEIKYSPWDKIKSGDVVYFQDSGEPVTVKAEVDVVQQFSNLTAERVKEILERYGKDDGIEKEKIPEFFDRFKDKKYCMLIFLKNPQLIKPFRIDKTGFGMMSAWISIENINDIKKIT